MSSAEGEAELKGGHPPAVKAGGMRIVQNKSTHSGTPDKGSPPKKEESGGDPKEVKVSIPPKSQALVQMDILPKMEKEMKEKEVKHAHEKPQPTHERPVQHVQRTVIQQPRKQ